MVVVTFLDVYLIQLEVLARDCLLSLDPIYATSSTSEGSGPGVCVCVF